MPKKAADFLVNPTGNFVVGGPDGDCGLTGRKIIVDTYGGYAPHGGGAFSGKDPTKVDRSAAYAARYLAKNVVAAGLADRCTIQIAYAIGVADPMSLLVDTHGTGKVEESKLEKVLPELFRLTPTNIRRTLKLNRPIYRRTASYGHFGRAPEKDGGFSWERTDLAKEYQKRGELTARMRRREMAEQRRGGSFFGRRKGKALRPGQRQAMDTVLPKLLIDVGSPPPGRLAAIFSMYRSALCGWRSDSAAASISSTRRAAIPMWASSASSRSRAGSPRPSRRSRARDSAISGFSTRTPCSSSIGCPKHQSHGSTCSSRIHGRRSDTGSAASSVQANLDRVVRCLASGGEFRFATDVESYAEWTRDEVARHARLERLRDSMEPWPDWPGTRYEAKAARAGRGAWYMTFR